MEKLHIFDIDGTVLDSMVMWENLPCLYLRNLGIEPPDGIAEIIDPMTVPECEAYIADRFNIEGGQPAIAEGIHAVLQDYYVNKLEPFDDILPELDELKSKGEKMIVFSNTPHYLLDMALDRCNLMKYFERVFCVEDIGIRKDNPDAFKSVCHEMGVEPVHAIMYDDSDYALNAARAAGLTVKEYDRYRGIGRI